VFVCVSSLTGRQYLASVACMTGTSMSRFSCRMTHLRRSQWPRDLRRGTSSARMLGLRVRIPLGGGGMALSFVSVVSGRGLCVELITRPVSPTECRVCQCDCEVSIMRRHWPTRAVALWTKIIHLEIRCYLIFVDVSHSH